MSLVNADEQKVLDLIDEHKGVLIRNNKHRVWKFPTGEVFVMPSTASDRRSYKNSLSALRHVLNIVPQKDSSPSPVHDDRRKQRRQYPSGKPDLHVTRSFPTAMAEQLALSGILHEAEASTITLLKEQNGLLMHQLKVALEKGCECWWCAMRRFVTNWFTSAHTSNSCCADR